MSPFSWVSERAQPGLLAVLTALFLALSVWLAAVNAPLVGPEAPYGIVSYELAGSAARAEAILASWSAEARAWAMLSLGLDYLYLLVYAAWLSLSALRLSAPLGSGWRRAGAALAWAVLAAAPLDALENHALVQQIASSASPAWARLAWWCAVPKFALAWLALAYLVVAGGLRAWRAGSRSRPA